jgi:predicted GNAT family N-acyltransferase
MSEEPPKALIASVSRQYVVPIGAGSSTMRIEIISTDLLGEKQLTSIIALKSQYWPYPLQSQAEWFKQNAETSDSHVLGWKADNLVAYLRLVPAKGMQEHRTVPLAIVDTVCIDSNHRRQSLGLELMTRGNEAIHLVGRVGLLASAPSLVPFYQRCGWSSFPLPVQPSAALRALLPEGSAALTYDPVLRLSRLRLDVSPSGSHRE